MNKNILIALLLIVLIAVSGIIGYFIGNRFSESEYESTNSQPSDFTESREGGYKFINPLLECDNFNKSKLSTYVRLEEELNAYVAQSLSEKKSTHISVYFRDLNNGPWIGIKENEIYSPASLLKVPIMVAVLKRAEMDIGFLSRKIDYTELLDVNYVPNIKDTILKIGESYTVEELTYRMIKYSDNEAKTLLVNLLGDELLYKVSSDLGVNLRGMDLSKDNLSVKRYSSFFRILYNATYLSKEMSEIGLEMLSHTKFDIGIPAGLPKGIVVAHKFGERGFADNNTKQLHDCGIVYFPGSPYLLCVMTRGTDFNQLAAIISDISSIVYSRVNDKNNR
jgi:beta-lactamase class A